MKYFSLILTVLLWVSCATKPVSTVPRIDADGNLTGIVTKTDFLKPPFVSWFDREYNGYVADARVVAGIKKLLADEQITIKAVMGTWCSDSRREVPHFYKILDMAHFDYSRLKMAAVNRQMEVPATLGKLQVERVPTFIFYRKGKELHRIVEYPVETLEKDMYKILSGQSYRHAYE